ncbi:MAG: carboxypeptidase-like regulatory domain-containing protein, partial [Leeuwenhoekiella sp.]
MKSFLLIFFFLLTGTVALSQNSARNMIEGQLIAPKGGDPEGIVIYNTSSERGTITDIRGVFSLAVAKNDEVLVQSVQYSPVTVMVTSSIMQSKKMTITLRESVNTLDEIVVTPYDLTGNIVADVNIVNVQSGVQPVNFGAIRLEDGQYDELSAVDNVAMDNETWKYGLNFVNVFKALFSKRKADKTEFTSTAQDELSQLYDNAFFKQNLDIKEEDIGDFIDYTANNGLE